MAGMTSLFIPDASHLEQVLDGIPDDAVLAHFKWTEVQPAGPKLVTQTFDFTKSLSGQARTTTGLLHAMITGYEHSKLEQKKDRNSHYNWDNTQYPNLDHVALKFVWKDDGNLLMDNTSTNLGTFSPRMIISKSFALKMGWVTEMIEGSQHVYDLGPNLIQTVLKKADGTDRWAWDIHSEWIDKGWGSRPRDKYWGIAHNNKLYLSIAANWTFVVHWDLSQHGSQWVQIRSNLIQSSIFNDTLLNLLAEVMYKRESNGMVHIELINVRYIPVHQPLIDIIEIDLYNLLGQRLQLKGGRSSITLHFKRP